LGDRFGCLEPGQAGAAERDHVCVVELVARLGDDDGGDGFAPAPVGQALNVKVGGAGWLGVR
jgi:hypothetical protein